MSTIVGSKIYVLGGYDGYESLNKVEVIDLKEENPQSKELKPMMMRIKNGSCFYNERDKKIYIVGGWDEKDTQDKIFKYDMNEQ